MSVQRMKLICSPPLWRLLAVTVRVTVAGERHDPGREPAIYASLHRDMLPAILYVRRIKPTLLVSRSPDGDILLRTLAPDGFGFVRGSTGPQGGAAFVRLLAALREGHSVGLAVDGPKGPFGEVYEGVVQLSRRAQLPIVPLTFRLGKHRVMGTWDRTVVPRPFSQVKVHEGEPLLVAADAGEDEIERQRQCLAAALLAQPANGELDATVEGGELGRKAP